MIERKVFLSNEAQDDIDDVSDYIIAVSRPSHAVRYTREMLAELNTLSYRASMIAEPIYAFPKRFHPEAKMTKLRNKPLSVIFHTEGEYVIIDRIVHSSMITY